MQNIYYENQSGTFLFSSEKQTGFTTMPKNHYHDAYELYYLLSGERDYFIKDRIYKIRKGDLVFINIYDLHRTIDAGSPSYERLLVNFKLDFFMPCEKSRLENMLMLFTKGVNVLSLPIMDQSFVEDIFYKMHQEAELKRSGFEELLLSLLIQLLIFSIRCVDSGKTLVQDKPDPNHEKVSIIVQFINSHYMEPLTLFSLAQQFYISPYYFCKLFKKYSGFTFIEYLNNLRVKEAQKLLRESTQSVLLISENVGFGSISHFGRIFKELSGVSPLHYRTKNK